MSLFDVEHLKNGTR